jgi:hypothetical protein
MTDEQPKTRQLSLVEYEHEIQEERREIDRKNADRRSRRAYVVFATDPERVGKDDYKLIFACEARSQAEAERKIRSIVGDRRRVLAYLASGKYGQQLPEARWVA